MDDNKTPRAAGNVYDQAEPVDLNRLGNIRIVDNRKPTGESGTSKGRRHYEVPEPVGLPPRRLDPGPPTPGSGCSHGRQEGVYEEAVTVVLQPGEESLQRDAVGHEDHTPAQKGVPQLEDGNKYLACRWMTSSSRLICVTIATVALVTLVVKGTALVTTGPVTMTTRDPSHQMLTPSWSSSTPVTILPTEQTTALTSETAKRTSLRAHVTLPRTTSTPDGEAPPLLQTEWIHAGADVKGVDEMAMGILLGQKGSGPGEFANPRGVAMTAENEILVADMFNRRVQVHDMKGVHRRQFPTATPGGYMVAPEDVTIDVGGNLWIVGKYGTNSVAVKYNRDGLPLATIPLRQTAFVRGVAVNPKTHQVLVTETDGRTGEVLMFGTDGEQERRFGRQEGMLHPWYVSTNMEGNILVSDLDTNNVYMYNQSGGFLDKFRGRFLHPEGLCTDWHGNIIVADSGNRRVEVLTGRGEHVRYVASGLGKPSGVAVGPAGQMVVTYGLKNIVAIFTL
ncbi:TRIM2 [Branchiostoma lanceolatum]|uniref:TRIM2 protein n=1 Tax=Branchiostoma lanceolatum TaxID=7740 RepID=A0A8J9ZA44_BRALA|nr:TRIM2 [Branchiostoma lanceolatum]